MQKKYIFGAMVTILALTLVMTVLPVVRVDAQVSRSIVPSPRITVEAIDPASGMSKNTFCTGVNTIDIRLTNNSGYGQFVSVTNQDTRGAERTLYSGQLQTGVSYLSRLLGTQLALNGPAGTETVKVVTSQGQAAEGWVSYYVQECGSPGPGPWPGYAQVWGWVYPYAIEQGKKGTVILQTSVGSQQNATYYFEILNSWGQLWKRIPVTKMPYDYYQITLPVGTKTKPAVLTYTVNLYVESGMGGQQQKIGSAQFSFQVVAAGATPSPYPQYPGYSGYPQYQGYPEHPSFVPYGGTPYTGMPGYGTVQPYGIPSDSTYPYYGVGAMGGPVGERQVP